MFLQAALLNADCWVPDLDIIIRKDFDGSFSQAYD
jgi:hypothetical protein